MIKKINFVSYLVIEVFNKTYKATIYKKKKNKNRTQICCSIKIIQKIYNCIILCVSGKIIQFIYLILYNNINCYISTFSVAPPVAPPVAENTFSDIVEHIVAQPSIL